MSPVDEGTPPKNLAESWIADKVDIDEIVKIGTLEELVPSFVFTTDKEHEELDMEPADLVEKTIDISAQILSDFEKSYQAVIAKVVASSISYHSSQTEEDSETEEPQVISVAGRAKMAVADEFRKLAIGIVARIAHHLSIRVVQWRLVHSLRTYGSRMVAPSVQCTRLRIGHGLFQSRAMGVAVGWRQQTGRV